MIERSPMKEVIIQGEMEMAKHDDGRGNYFQKERVQKMQDSMWFLVMRRNGQ